MTNALVDYLTLAERFAAILVEGIVQRRGKGAGIMVQNAKPMSLQDIVIRTEIGRSQSRPASRLAPTPKQPQYWTAAAIGSKKHQG